jgi:hypothetical protein
MGRLDDLTWSDDPDDGEADTDLAAAEVGLRASRELEEGLWQADLIPLPVFIASEPAARPLLAVVVASGGVDPWIGDVMDAPAEISDVVNCVANALKGMLDDGHFPKTIELRHRAIVDVMAGPFQALGVEVRVNPSLAAVDAVAAPVLAALPGGQSRTTPFSRPGSWAAWKLSPDQCRRLFAAAARLYRSDVWDGMHDHSVFKAQRGKGPEWLCRLRGVDQPAGISIGALPGPDPAGDAASDLSLEEMLLQQFADLPAQINLSFVPRDVHPTSMLAEIDAAGWTVANSGAYPSLVPLYTPAGGITREQAEDLIAIMAGIPDFVELHPVELASRKARMDGATWTHPESGVTFAYHGGFEQFNRFVTEQLQNLLSDEPPE